MRLILKQPRRPYRINYLHRGTNLEINDLFWIEKILKPQEHLLSIKHWLFFMTLGCFSGDCFFRNSFDVQFVEAVLSSTFYQVLFKVFFIDFTYDFEQAKHIEYFNFNSILPGPLVQLINQWSCNYNMSSSSPSVSRKGQLCEGRHRRGSWMGCSCCIWVTKRVQGVEKTCKLKTPVAKKCSFKTVALSIKNVMQKPGKSKATESNQSRA